MKMEKSAVMTELSGQAKLLINKEILVEGNSAQLMKKEEKEKHLIINAETLQMKDKMLEEKGTFLSEDKEKLKQMTEETHIQLKQEDPQLKKMLLREKKTLLENTEKEVETSKNQLEILREELQEKSSELHAIMILLAQKKTELREKDKQLEEKERLLRKRDTRLMERDNQLQDPDPVVPLRRRNSKQLMLPKSSTEEVSYTGDFACLYVFPRQSLVFCTHDRQASSESILQTVHEKENEISGDSTPPYADTTDLLSAHTNIFTPEEAKVSLGDGTLTFYRFQCPHAGLFQCKFTSLVFEMEGRGEVLYRILSWDTHLLNSLGQMQPAGPLYDINCKGSISHLHLLHCEILSEKNQAQQAVAHFTDGNVEIISPLRVTTTHVIIRIQGLSLFGLIRNLFQANPISAQVLLFHKNLSGRQRRRKVHIHLLPRNVPVEEVMKKHPHSKYIDTSSKCQLTPGRKYKPSCDPYVSQPKVEQFECDYGPNYHPTFEVFIDLEAEDATIGLLDENEQVVWEPRLVFLTEGTTLQTDAARAIFVDEHRETLIQRVSSIMEILDGLRSHEMISKEMYDKIKAAKPCQEQMRLLYDNLHSGGQAVKVQFYDILKKKLPYLVKELEAGPSHA
ncbi:NACHT, LRR and PYD domains-containing protein 1-like [Salminus brasiliensis]|uniref:NACHT, LRR and PYD domains-containing protein 1-like n=1 Tax=Salminus brasiliensis TaxID=930266 RepID=UPI003B83291B